MSTPVALPTQTVNWWDKSHKFDPKSFQGREQLACDVCGYTEGDYRHKLPMLESDEFMLMVAKKYDIVVIEDWRSAALRIYHELCQLKAATSSTSSPRLDCYCNKITCPVCYPPSPIAAPIPTVKEKKCEPCRGSGRHIAGSDCPNCNGTGLAKPSV